MANGSSASDLCRLAREHLKAGQLDEGEAAARQATALDPRSDDAHALLGIVLCRKGNTPAGIDALGQAVVLNPANVVARTNLATARQQAGHLEAARAEWQAVLGLDPSNTKARGALAVVEWQIQQKTGATRSAAAPPLDLSDLGGPTQPAASAPAFDLPPAGAHVQAAPAQPAVRYDLAGNPIPVPPQTPPPPPQPSVRYDLTGNPIPVQPPAQPLPHPAYGQQQPGYGPPPTPQGYRYGAGRPGAGPYAQPNIATGDDPGGWSLENVFAILFSPGEFMARQRGYHGLGKPIVFYVINQAILGAVAIAATIIQMSRLSASGTGAGLAVGAGIVGGVIGLVIGAAVGLGVQLGMAGLVHLFATWFGGRHPYGATYRPLVYASVPLTAMYIAGALLTLLSPMLAILSGLLILGGLIWCIVVASIGLAETQEISSGAAFGALVLGGIVGVIIMVVLAMLIVGVTGATLSSLLENLGRSSSTNPFTPSPQYHSPFGPGGGFDTAPPGFSGPSGFRGPSGMRGFPGYPR